MDPMSRRNVLTAAAAGGLATAATAVCAQTGETIPQPVRPGRGGTDHGPRNLMRDRQNPDLLVPPSTDQGTLPNLRFSFADAHMRLASGGWTRQITSRELGVSKNPAARNRQRRRPANADIGAALAQVTQPAIAAAIRFCTACDAPIAGSCVLGSHHVSPRSRR